MNKIYRVYRVDYCTKIEKYLYFLNYDKALAFYKDKIQHGKSEYKGMSSEIREMDFGFGKSFLLVDTFFVGLREVETGD